MHINNDLAKKISIYILITSLLILVFLTYANRIDDLDLWWHLKNGQFIFETHTLPQKDYFSFTTEIPEDISKIGKDEVPPAELPSEKNKWFWPSFINHSWLSEIIFYIAYLLGGFKGLGIFKSIIFVFTYFVIYLAMFKRGAGYLSAFFVLCLIALIGADFNSTRPQILSFLLFSCVLYIFYDFRKGGRSIYFLPLFMLLWANLHGGFILGVLLILTISLAELLKVLFKDKSVLFKNSSLSKEKLKILIIFSIISVAVSLLNPNHYKTFLFPLIQQQSLFANIEEYHKPMLYEYHLYWFMLVLVIIYILISIKKKSLDITELFLSFIVILPSLNSIRYIIFFALGTSVFLAYTISNSSTWVKEWRPVKKLFNNLEFLKIKGYISLLLAIVFFITLISTIISGQILKFDVREKLYPSDAAAFIQKNNIPGNIFNLFNWGSYLIWRLSPDYRVFIDGRCLNETAIFHYNQILKAEKGNKHNILLWEKLLNAYDVNFILTSAVSSSGNIIPLVDMLYVSSGWELIYGDGKSLIFLRNIPTNQSIIHQYQISKEKIVDEIISECKQGIEETPATWGYYETMGYMYMKRNRLNEASAMFQKYLSMNPNNEKVRYYHNLIKQYLNQ